MRAVAILAAGSSKRFGPDDKLQASLQGKPILEHVINTVKNIEADCIFLIEAKINNPRDGITSIFNPHAKKGQGSSIGCAARTALDMGVNELLIVLGDMPFVTERHLKTLCSMTGDVAFSQNDERLMPPAIFRGHAIKPLIGLSGDAGARSVDWSKQGFKIEACQLPALEARDIDTADDLVQAQAQSESRAQPS